MIREKKKDILFNQRHFLPCKYEIPHIFHNLKYNIKLWKPWWVCSRPPAVTSEPTRGSQPKLCHWFITLKWRRFKWGAYITLHTFFIAFDFKKEDFFSFDVAKRRKSCYKSRRKWIWKESSFVFPSQRLPGNQRMTVTVLRDAGEEFSTHSCAHREAFFWSVGVGHDSAVYGADSGRRMRSHMCLHVWRSCEHAQEMTQERRNGCWEVRSSQTSTLSSMQMMQNFKCAVKCCTSTVWTVFFISISVNFLPVNLLRQTHDCRATDVKVELKLLLF